MAGQFISKEQQKKAPIQGGQFIPKGTVNVPITEVKSPINSMLQRSAPLAVGAGGLAGSYVAGKALEGIGKKIYGVNLPPTIDEARALQSYKAGVTKTKPRIATDVLIDTPIIQKTPINQVMRSPTSPLGGMGTRSMIGTQAESAANKIFTNKINPIFDKLEKTGIKLDVPTLVNQAKNKILASKKYAPSQIDEIIANIDELAEGLQQNLSVKQLDLEKQALVGKIPKKYMNMPKLPSEVKSAQKELASEFRKAVHGTIKKMSGTDSAKLYQDWASLKGISEIGPKAATQAGRKGGSGTFMSWVADELATPVTTTAGKLTYKTGKLLQYLPKKIVETIKKAPSTLKGMPMKTIASNIIKSAPVGVLSEMFGQNVRDIASGDMQKSEYKRALEKMKASKDLGVMEAVTKSMIKGLDRNDAILLLEKLSK